MNLSVPLFRIKTFQELKNEGYINTPTDIPLSWNKAGIMNKLMGHHIPKEYNSRCLNKHTIFVWGWSWRPQYYTLINKDYDIF